MKLLILFLFPIALLAQETTFFDAEWKETSKQNAVYYRETSKIDELYKIVGFYSDTKTKQFESLSKTKVEPFQFEGSIVCVKS